jgi:hypothetical protein
VDFRGEGRLNLELVLKKMVSHFTFLMQMGSTPMKQGTALPPANSKLFTTISPSSLPTPPKEMPSLYDQNSAPTLRPTWEAILKETNDNQPCLIILDGLVELSYLGFEPKEITRLTRAVLSRTRKVRSSAPRSSYGV